MNVIQLGTFDIALAAPWQLVSTSGFWAALPRLSVSNWGAKLLMVADTLRLEDIEHGFQQVAVPEEHLPSPRLRSYRMQYDDFLKRAAADVRYIRLYLVADTSLDDAGLCNLLGAYGLRAWPLDHAIPLPFEKAAESWDHVRDEGGGCWALLRSKSTQHGILHPRLLHSLFVQDFPVWAALHIHTFSQADGSKLLRAKSATARFMPQKDAESVQDASEAMDTIGRLRHEMTRTGGLLHAIRLYVLLGGETPAALKTRVEVTRGAVSLEMQRVHPPGETMRRVFSSLPLYENDGAMLTSPGVALLTGSALSYRRRTETKGVLLGTDRNQAPVIFNIFDARNPFFNMVILGQTGSGKTFAALLLMLRHLLLGTRLVIVDPQGNVDLGFLGSDVVHKAVLGTGNASINILDITREEIGQQVETVCAMLTLLGVLRRGDALARALLDSVLLDIYQPIWDRLGVPAPTLSAVQRRLESLAQSALLPAARESASLLAFTLNPYTRGSYASLFNRPTAVDFSLQRPVTIYDVSMLPGEELGNLRSALLSILVADVNQGIRRLRKAGDITPVLFFVDEMGVLMRDEVIASYISYEYKTARARRVGMVVADQDLHSLLGPVDAKGLHHGAPILANSAFTLLFYQKDTERGRIRETFSSLAPELAESLFSLPRGVCLAQFPDDLLLVSVQPSAFEQAVLSSQLADQARKRRVIARMTEEFA